MAAHRRVNSASIMMAPTQHSATIRPNSSPTTPKARSVLAAPRYFSQPFSGPTPKQPPEAMADMVRLC